MHGASAEVKVNVTVDKIPTVVINTQQRSVVLNKTLDGGYDYDGLKEAIFNECMRIEGVEGLTWNNFTYQYKVYEKAGGLIGTYQAFELDKIAGDPDGTWYKYLRDGGNFEIKVSIPDSSSYYGAEAEFTVDVTIGDPYDAEIALKNNYQKDYVLNYGADGQFDYDRLEKEIFDAVIDVENSTASVSFETATITYQILDAMGSPVGIGAGSYYDFAQGTLPADSGNTYKYLYKGGTFNIKVAVPATESHRAVEVVFSVNVEPYSRVSSSVVLNGGSMNYTNDLNAIKAYVYSLIDMNASKLPLMFLSMTSHSSTMQETTLQEIFPVLNIAGYLSRVWSIPLLPVLTSSRSATVQTRSELLSTVLTIILQAHQTKLSLQ